MLGASSGLQFSKNRNGDDRFCSVARPRLNSNTVNQSDVSSNRSAPDKCNPAAELAVQQTNLCNLERFLESVTPSVPAQYLPKMTVRTWTKSEVEDQPFYVLSDLWESFKEWSVYGLGVPLILNDSDAVVQYYVPYLSGIQLYADLSKNASKSSGRRLGEESDGDSFRDSSSDGSSDNEQDVNGLNYNQHQLCNGSLGVDKSCLREQTCQEGFSSDDGESTSPHGRLLFEYLASDQPYYREPLTDKISDLALRFPELKTLRSCDLLQSSWLSVAWYPIYRIPTGPTLKDLDACFLTFHSLHTPVTGREVVNPPIVTHPTEGDGVPQISLTVFGLASYKYKASLWTSNTINQQELANSLSQAADNWLNLLRVNHPDFTFFSRR